METCNSEVTKISNSDFTLAIFLNFWIFFRILSLLPQLCQNSITFLDKV